MWLNGLLDFDFDVFVRRWCLSVSRRLPMNTSRLRSDDFNVDDELIRVRCCRAHEGGKTCRTDEAKNSSAGVFVGGETSLDGELLREDARFKRRYEQSRVESHRIALNASVRLDFYLPDTMHLMNRV